MSSGESRRSGSEGGSAFGAKAARSEQPKTFTVHRHFTPRDRETGRYQYVPIDVDDGTATLTISYRYTGQDSGASVIDFGLFEPGPLTLGAASLRGYSGGAQHTITVGRDDASPGYRTGPLPPGRWHVLLGLYRVAPDGVDVAVDVVASRERRAALPPRAANVRPPRAISAGTSGPRWYAGGLHLHTTHSDGTIGPAELADSARAAGLDFIVITDHNNTTHTRERLPEAPLHITGEEVTTPSGHANVWGLPPGALIDFRTSARDPGDAAAIDGFVAAAHAVGALFSINHPFGPCDGCSWEHEIPRGLDAVEIWNGEDGPQQPAVELWDRLLREGRRVTAVGASDWHRVPARIDGAAVRVYASALTERAILDGLRRGHVVVVRDSRSASPTLTVTCGSRRVGIGDQLTCSSSDTLSARVSVPGGTGLRAEFMWNGERAASAPFVARGFQPRDRGPERAAPQEATFARQAANGYLRMDIRDAEDGIVAMTNPVYVAIR